MTSPIDLLILGQGLAGSTLAWRLAERGVSAVVLDRGGVDLAGRPTASRVAAGLITPVSGKRLTIAEGFEERWSSAHRFYRRVEAETDTELLAEQPAVRVFVDEVERAKFADRGVDSRFAQHARLAEPSELPTGVEAPLGGFVMPGAARLNVAAFLDATLAWLAASGRFLQADVHPEQDVVLRAGRVEIPSLGVTAKRLVFCEGHTDVLPSWVTGTPFDTGKRTPAKGEVLTVEIPSLRTDRVTHRGVWIVPDESGVAGRYRVGSTNDWEQLDSEPTAAGRDELLGRLAEAGITDARVVDHQAAVRPATSDRLPVFGLSAEEPRVGWLNGLGAKGSLWAPWAAEQLADLVLESRA